MNRVHLWKWPRLSRIDNFSMSNHNQLSVSLKMGFAVTEFGVANHDSNTPLLPRPSIERHRLYLVGAALATAAIMTAAAAFGLCFLIYVSGSFVRDGHAQPLTRSRIVEADVGVVAADHVLCSDVGVAVLKRGGNAIDAAVAVAFCQGVANPGASGIGGGDFMVLRLSNGIAEAWDMRETAPQRASESMYANDLGGKTVGGLAVAVPGEVKGLYEVWQKHGTLPWASLVEPAILLARDGFPLPPYLASQIQISLSDILGNRGLRDVFAPNGRPLLEGHIYTRKKLAKTLKAIAKHGSDAFYYGKIAEAMVEDVQAAGGILTMADLADYEVLATDPSMAETWGHTVIGMPPPSSGGPGLIMILNILAAFKNSVEAIKGDIGVHHIVEAFKHTYAVRAYLGDPLFENITGVVADMMSPDFAAMLQKTIFDNTTFGPDHYGGKYNHYNEGNEHGTSHFSIVDGDRNAVAMTCTVNYAFGAKFISERTGILMNNEMDDFGTPLDNITDGLPAKPNFIKPNKRPLSTMSPTIVLKDGQVRAVLGGSGGIKILTTVAQVLLNVFAGEDPLSAVSLPRFHHKYLPNVLYYENYTAIRGEIELIPDSTRDFLLERGHVLESESSGAVSQLIVHDLDRGKLIGVCDLRKDGYPSGY